MKLSSPESVKFPRILVLLHLENAVTDSSRPERTVEKARAFYLMHTHHEMDEILKGRGKKGAFTPSPGIKGFLLELKTMNLKLGLVTSGLYEKAYPEILSAFSTLGWETRRIFTTA